jgi:hypothetical protein
MKIISLLILAALVVFIAYNFDAPLFELAGFKPMPNEYYLFQSFVEAGVFILGALVGKRLLN